MGVKSFLKKHQRVYAQHFQEILLQFSYPFCWYLVSLEIYLKMQVHEIQKVFFKIDFNPICTFWQFQDFPRTFNCASKFYEALLNSELHVKYVYLCIYEKKKYLKNADRFPKMSIFIAVDGRSHDLFACGPEFRLLLSRKVKSKRQNLVQKILKVHTSPNF